MENYLFLIDKNIHEDFDIADPPSIVSRINNYLLTAELIRRIGR